MFKKGIQPAWEDAANSHGGEFQIMFENIDQKPEVIDAIFRDVIVTILSSEYKFQEEVRTQPNKHIFPSSNLTRHFLFDPS